MLRDHSKSLEIGQSIYMKVDISRYLSYIKIKQWNETIRPFIQRKELQYKNNLLCDFIHSNVMNKRNILYVAFDASFLLLLLKIMSQYLGWQAFDIDIGRNSACK